jgi:hypothetical protein
VETTGHALAELLASAEEQQEQLEHVEHVEEDRRGEQRRGADVLGAAQPLEVESVSPAKMTRPATA